MTVRRLQTVFTNQIVSDWKPLMSLGNDRLHSAVVFLFSLFFG